MAAFVLAAITHRHHAGLWSIPATVTITAISVLATPRLSRRANSIARFVTEIAIRAREACGIIRPAERVYAAIVIATAGGWLSAAIAAGPTTRPLPRIAIIATIVLGIPWWAHRRRRARVRIERTVHAWPGMAESMGLPGSRIASATGNSWGFTARVILRKGGTAAEAIERIPSIESGLGLRPGSVRALPDPHRADRFILRVIDHDPHAQPLTWPGQPATSITRPARLGLFEDGEQVHVTLLRRNILIGGTTGSGKSGVLNVILAFLAACADVVIWGVDLKGGIELQPWAPSLARLATTAEQACALFREALAELDSRSAWLTSRGVRTWEPNASEPALILVVDEYAELPDEAQDCADSLARRGRAVAVNLIAATQRPTQEAMGHNAVRSQMDVRVCLRVRERRDVDLILGQGSLAAGWHAHSLSQPGAFLISDPEHNVPCRARGYLITDDQVAAHARQHAGPVQPDDPWAIPRTPQNGQDEPTRLIGQDEPDATLWAMLRRAGAEGVSARALALATGMGRTWVYERLREHADEGRAVQVRHGYWRATGAIADPQAEPTT